MGVFVKICGIASQADCAAVSALRPDAMGFVFWKRSPRAVDAEAVAKWTQSMDPAIVKVGVFVDAPAPRVAEVMQAAGLDVAQLHGNESPEVCRAVGGTVWKAVHLDRVDAAALSGYRVDAFLVDSYSAESPGGTGKVADWGLARRFVETVPTPVLLAGGLNPDNVREAVEQVCPWGVDVSSGVEQSPGRKDLERVRRFIEACRS